MSTARVVQQQDSADPPRRWRCESDPRAPLPKTLIVRAVRPDVVRLLIAERHYLHSMPAAAWRCFGVYAGTTLAGAVVFTAGARNGHRVLLGAKPQQVATLARLWLADELPKNAESRVIGVVLRALRREGEWKALLSYADPAAGHVGTIYQATGWQYLGQSEAVTYVDLGDGRAVHPRTVYERLGSNAIGHLQRTGVPAHRVRMTGKHRYTYLLDPTWRWRLRDRPRPYPRRAAP